MKIRIIETREYIYEPDFENEFYEECTTMREAIEADIKWIEDKKGKLEDLDSDVTTTSVKWQVYDDVTQEVVYEVM